MNRGNKPWQTLPPAEIDWTKNASPNSIQYDDVYYSSECGAEESRYVFLQGSDLPHRLSNDPKRTFCIVETGFGTGLNFLLTWQLWIEQPEPRPRLHFLSIEKHPLGKDDLRRALTDWPELEAQAAALIEYYPHPIPGQHRIVLEGGKLTLDLWWEDAEDALSELAGQNLAAVDAWYLDGFSPNRNQDMWTEKIFACMAACSRKDATFATFTAASHVRRALLNVGFSVSKLPGFGKKRESLHGQFKGLTDRPAISHSKQKRETPWHLRSYSPTTPSTAIVLGAGLAGCTVAAALARRNVSVIIIDSGSVANAGSGNDQGVLYTRLSHMHSPLSDFSLQSYSFALGFYRQLLSSGQLVEGIDGNLCGCFHQSDKQAELAALAPLLQSVPDLAQVLSAAEANEILGVEQTKGGYWHPGSGWMRPASICHALLKNDRIQLMENAGTVALEQAGSKWTAVRASRVLAEAQCAVIAAGTASASIAALDWLPLRSIRGQTTSLPSTAESKTLLAALCHKGYISPARRGRHCIGATFDIDDTDTDVREGDHRFNLDSLAAAVPNWQTVLGEFDEQTLEGRVGYRCASPDYLPLVGPVPVREMFLQNYAALRKNARKTIACKGEFRPGLYLSTGHGSRGLSSTPLAAETLASLICGEPMPLSSELYRAISPGRFIIRNLRRKQD